MLNCETLLEYVQRTNPGMNMDKLLKELSKSDSSTVALVYEFVNHFGKQNCFIGLCAGSLLTRIPVQFNGLGERLKSGRNGERAVVRRSILCQRCKKKGWQVLSCLLFFFALFNFCYVISVKFIYRSTKVFWWFVTIKIKLHIANIHILLAFSPHYPAGTGFIFP